MKVIQITLKEGEGCLITISKKKNTSRVFLSEKEKTAGRSRKEVLQR